MDDNDTGIDPSQGEDNRALSTDGFAGAGAMVISSDGKALYAVGKLDDAIVHLRRAPG